MCVINSTDAMLFFTRLKSINDRVEEVTMLACFRDSKMISVTFFFFTCMQAVEEDEQVNCLSPHFTTNM